MRHDRNVPSCPEHGGHLCQDVAYGRACVGLLQRSSWNTRLASSVLNGETFVCTVKFVSRVTCRSFSWEVAYVANFVSSTAQHIPLWIVIFVDVAQIVSFLCGITSDPHSLFVRWSIHGFNVGCVAGPMGSLWYEYGPGSVVKGKDYRDWVLPRQHIYRGNDWKHVHRAIFVDIKYVSV